MGTGEWGLGTGDWGLGTGDWGGEEDKVDKVDKGEIFPSQQSTINNQQSTIHTHLATFIKDMLKTL